MKREAEWMYKLLPAIYRIRDQDQGDPLKGLLAVLSEQAENLEGDIAQLYKNWFIETCEEWVVPYLGDLLGVRGLHPVPGADFTLRAYVANTLAYRRRKGTAAVLEQLARDTTGWTSRVVEFFQLLATTQFMNHIRLAYPGTASLRDADALELLGGPFEHAPHSVEVRRVASGRGRYNIPNVGLYLWRLQSYPLTRVKARQMVGLSEGCFMFSPLGNDAPLFNRPQTEMEITHLAEEINVPGILRRRPLFAELKARRAALERKETPQADYFGVVPVLQVYLGGEEKPLPPEDLVACDLSNWDKSGWSAPKPTKYFDADGNQRKTRVAVDPAIGRLVLLDEPSDMQVETSHSYGFSADVGGGPYNRQSSLPSDLLPKVSWQAGVGQKAAAVHGEQIVQSLGEAVQQWNLQPAGQVGLIALMDSGTYEEEVEIEIKAGSRLIVVAGDWPKAMDVRAINRLLRRATGQVIADNVRPHVKGRIKVRGTAPDWNENPGELILNGLLVEGDIVVKKGNLGRLCLLHSTLVPGGALKPDGSPNDAAMPSLSVHEANTILKLEIGSSILGQLWVPMDVAGLSISDSILRAFDGGFAISADGSDAPAPPTVIERTTVFGKVRVKELKLASEVIFTEAVIVDRRQSGCVRFSFVPDDFRTPRQHRCQPDLALRQAAQAKGKASVADLSLMEVRLVRDRVVPQFTSQVYGTPGFAQLSSNCASEIRTGAEDGSEMGAFSLLKQPQRLANLRVALDEYLRTGLDAGIFFVT